MSYAYEYTEGLKQFGMVHLILKLTDSDNILPEVTIPVVLDESEYFEENISKIANTIIDSYTQSTPVIEEPLPVIEEPLPVIEEEITSNNLSIE